MRYTDLVTHTANLTPGKHVIYDLEDGKVSIRNMGQRNWMMSDLPEHRLFLFADGREIAPRHSDFIYDFQLKLDTRPELLELLQAKKLPARFSTLNDETWSMQTSAYQTGGLPTVIYLAGLQTLIRVYEINKQLDKPAEAFRQAFINLEHNGSLLDVLNTLQPKVMPKKIYFNQTERPA
jgi:hypothetical protein